MAAHSVLFVCPGNICRSPLAEAALRSEVDRLELDVEVDSAGTGDWACRRPSYPRAIAVAARNGVYIGHLRARQVSVEDFRRFDHIVALDLENFAGLIAIRPADASAGLSLLLDHVPGRVGEAVADPYYSDDEHFDETWRDGTDGARGLARALAEQS